MSVLFIRRGLWDIAVQHSTSVYAYGVAARRGKRATFTWSSSGIKTIIRDAAGIELRGDEPPGLKRDDWRTLRRAIQQARREHIRRHLLSLAEERRATRTARRLRRER